MINSPSNNSTETRRSLLMTHDHRQGGVIVIALIALVISVGVCFAGTFFGSIGAEIVGFLGAVLSLITPLLIGCWILLTAILKNPTAAFLLSAIIEILT